MNYLTQAIRKLVPDSEFAYENNDYSTIIWTKLDGDAPTQKEIDDAIKQIKEEESQAKIEAANQKLAVENKLKALGLSVDDLKVLGLG